MCVDSAKERIESLKEKFNESGVSTVTVLEMVAPKKVAVAEDFGGFLVLSECAFPCSRGNSRSMLVMWQTTSRT